MSSADPRRLEWFLAALGILVCAAAAFAVTARASWSTPSPTRTARVRVALPPEPTRGKPANIGLDLAAIGAATTRVATPVFQAPDPAAAVVSRLGRNILLPIDGHNGSFVRVMTPCEVTGWIRTSDLVLHPRANGPPTSFEQAVFVLDPGHGGQQSGAIGPNGLMEKDANLAITHRLVGHLKGSRIFVTRSGDFTAGLRYRTAIANALGAHALISIHNNSVPDGPSEHPGSETWHQSQSAPAQRLSSFIWSSLVDALKPFKIRWVADQKAGTRTRLNEHGHDYYGLLRGSVVPTVIVEAMFISNAPEENLLGRPEGQDAVARAVANGLKHYVSKSRPDVSKPYAAAAGTTGGVPPVCTDPR